MNGYSAGNKAAEYALLVATGYTCAYSLLSLFVPSRIMTANVFPMLACSAAVLLLPCFFKRAAKIAGIVAAASVLILILYQVFAGSAGEMIAAALLEPGYVLIQIGSSITVLLCFLAAASSLTIFLCSKSRLAITVFWAASTALSIVLSLAGYNADTITLLVMTGCCAVLFVRSDVKSSISAGPDGQRLSLRMTALASGVFALLLAVTQLGFTGLSSAFGSSPKISIGDVAVQVRNILFSTTGFSDYNPNQPIGQRVTENNTLVLEVRADGPFYLRGRIYDTYTGRSWRTAEPTGSDDAFHQSLSLKPPGYFNSGSFYAGYSYGGSFYNRSNSLLSSRRISITTKTAGQKYLFLPSTAYGGPADMLDGRVALQHTYPDMETAQPLPAGTEYSLMYWQPDLAGDAFQSAIQNAAEGTERLRNGPSAQYQQIDREMQSIFGSTAGLTARTVALAQSITQGCSNEFQKAAAIEKWLESNCTYTLSPSQPRTSQDLVDYFLFDSKEGYCEHFATAMTMLMRAGGVPARYVEGYASPSVSGSGLYEVTNAQAHAWVEYYSPLYGFITADPTPASDLPRTLTRSDAQETLPSSSSAVSSEPSSSASSSSAPLSEAPSSAPSSGSPQSSAVPSVGSTPGSETGSGFSYYSAAVAVIILLLLSLYGGKTAYRALWFSVVRRRNDRKLALALYGYFAAVLMKLGFGIPSSGTPQELAGMVRGKMQFGEIGFDRVTQLYLEVRFGERGLAGGEREELFSFYRALPAACRKKLGRLRYLLMYPILH